MSRKVMDVYNLDGEPEDEKITLPPIFDTPIRFDVIKRAVLAIASAKRQPYGTDPYAGKRTTAESWGVGRAVARVPRVKGRGYAAASMGAFAPMTVGGRRTHPSTAEKKWKQKINKKEKRLAIRSATAATSLLKLVQSRGHAIEEVPQIPLIVTEEIENLEKTKEVIEFFEKIGVIKDIERVKKRKKVRAGKGKRRGRKYKQAKGPLIVVSEDQGIFKAASNIPGVDICNVKNLNAELLAPGTHPGRLTIWSKSAIKTLETENLFQQ